MAKEWPNQINEIIIRVRGRGRDRDRGRVKGRGGGRGKGKRVVSRAGREKSRKTLVLRGILGRRAFGS